MLCKKYSTVDSNIYWHIFHKSCAKLFGVCYNSLYGAEKSLENWNNVGPVRKEGIAYHNAKNLVCDGAKMDGDDADGESLGLQFFEHILKKTFLKKFDSVCSFDTMFF